MSIIKWVGCGNTASQRQIKDVRYPNAWHHCMRLSSNWLPTVHVNSQGVQPNWEQNAASQRPSEGVRYPNAWHKDASKFHDISNMSYIVQYDNHCMRMHRVGAPSESTNLRGRQCRVYSPGSTSSSTRPSRGMISCTTTPSVHHSLSLYGGKKRWQDLLIVPVEMVGTGQSQSVFKCTCRTVSEQGF